MNDQSGSARFQLLFEDSLREYEKQTNIALAEHSLAARLQHCDSIESVSAAILEEQICAHSEFPGSERIIKSLNSTVSSLYIPSASVNLSLPFSFGKAIYAGFSVLLATVKDVSVCDQLVELLESIESFLKHLGIYTKITPTVAMKEIVVNTLMELVSILALATQFIKQGQLEKFVRKPSGGKFDGMVLERLDRLTPDEARMTAAQVLEIVFGLVQNMRVVMGDGEASFDRVRGALEVMHDILNDVNKSKRETLQQSIFRWLSPPDPWKNHHISRESRHAETGAWFIQGDTFSVWKWSGPPISRLWIHGKPGTGKSVLCSTIIQDIDTMRQAGLVSLIFFYCDFREDQKNDLRGLLSSFLVQLCHQSDTYCDMLFTFYSEHGLGSRYPSDDALVGCLKDLLIFPGLAPVYFIVDALDECPITLALPSPRDEVLHLIEELVHSGLPNLRLCVTSRPLPDVKEVLEPLNFLSVSLQDESGQKRDIEVYIKSVINVHPKSRRWKAEHRRLVIGVLLGKADMTFQWVHCQVVYFVNVIPARIPHALAELPQTLDRTYERVLREIDKANWEFSHSLFQFVVVASRPLRVEELADFLAIDFRAGPIPKFQEHWRLGDPVDAVLSTCSSLLAIVGGGYLSGKVIQFSHFSVREYLMSASLAESSDIIPRRYHVSMTPAHTLAAQACLGVLLHLDKDVITRDGLEKYPSAEYAAAHCVDHVRLGGVSRHVEDGMKQLFDPDRSHLAIWVWIHDPQFPTRRQTERDKWPLPLTGTPLHYAVLWGLHIIVKFLVVEHSQDVRCRGLTSMVTPLHLASSKGDVSVARFLLEHGADGDARDNNNCIPLHWASQEGHLEVVRDLVERGIDVNARDHSNWTPLHGASQNGHFEVVRCLLEHGANTHASDQGGWTSLQWPSYNGDPEIVRVLLRYGADANTRDNSNWTPLHGASQQGHREVIQVLLEYGADANTHDHSNQTPLHLASREGHIGVARLLVESGANVDVRNNEGRTPLEEASAKGHEDVTKLLMGYGGEGDGF